MYNPVRSTWHKHTCAPCTRPPCVPNAGVSFGQAAGGTDAAAAVATHSGLWAGGVQLQQAPSIAKSRYRQQLEDAGRLQAGGSGLDFGSLQGRSCWPWSVFELVSWASYMGSLPHGLKMSAMLHITDRRLLRHAVGDMSVTDLDDPDQLEQQQQALEAAAAELHAEATTPRYWTDFLQVCTH